MRSAATDIDKVRRSTRSVLRALDDLTDEQASAPSRLPGWTRAEVITHLARNADGIRGMVEAAARGDVVTMYPSAEARAEGIAAGRGAAPAVLRADLRGAHDRLIDAWLALPDDAWERTGRMAAGTRTMRDFLWVRLREVEIHHVDLDVGYESSDWPVAFVDAALQEIFSSFPQRAAPTRLPVDIDYRVVTTDHDRAWRVELRGGEVNVAPDDGRATDGEAIGWGCDIAAWLYGRDPRGGGVLASGDVGVLRLPRWFPFG
ncbi:MAG TPA: maleylpyruvate isomerase family mycothiol-dependent enzyme [Acidimicrobiia bacterium]|nr:maleylpyruvate isomerase family mycothiol-dependent enzyme [Acidimicrobiia bacterium]